MKAWDIYLENEHGDDDELIDTVFYDNNCDAQYVHSGLINHDGYDPRIYIRCEATNEEWPETT